MTKSLREIIPLREAMSDDDAAMLAASERRKEMAKKVGKAALRGAWGLIKKGIFTNPTYHDPTSAEFAAGARWKGLHGRN